MKRILPVIVIAQFFCTSLWFAGNAIIADVVKQFNLNISVAGLTSAVQAGFIVGTLVFALLSIADRFSPVRVFFTCAWVAAVINLGISFPGVNTSGLILFRFFTGFFLAGIYPVGMKIAADHYEKGLGRSLGFLVGALVLGTAFPHLLKSMMSGLPWRYILYATSTLAAIGGSAMLLFVPDGPHRKSSQQLKLNSFLINFKNEHFRAAAFGYFGHMWELYAFWAFVPLMLTAYQDYYPKEHLSISFLSFLIIVAGSAACVISGIVSQTFGAKRVATAALTTSCLCCLLSPLLLFSNSLFIMLSFMLIWSMAVIADSPLFSTLVAQNAVPQVKGAALTIVNCVGFAITIVSIQFINALRPALGERYCYMLLAVGPLLGLLALLRKKGGHEKL